MTEMVSNDLAAVEAQIAWVLGHADISPWLKQALRSALDRDPVETGNDVEVLRHLLQKRARACVNHQQAAHGKGVRVL
jgi:hypothetical protein